VSAYSTISTEDSQVLTDLPPIDLLANERRTIYLEKWANENENTDIRSKAREKLLRDWQTRRDSTTKGRWIHRIIKNIEEWINRKHGKMSYHLKQAFTGHGCFAYFLHKIGKTPSPGCWYCDSPLPLDDAFHTIFNCDAWHHSRLRVEPQIGDKMHPNTILSVMMKTRDNWTAVREFIKIILSKKEEEERRRKKLKLIKSSLS